MQLLQLKAVVCYLFALSLMVVEHSLVAQPLSGTFTIGGANPDFLSFQSAADSLHAKGVSGPVIFLIRPGLYMEQDGAQPVMLLEQAVAGVSASNTITFQPDNGAGGNVDNVILQVEGDANPPTGGMAAIGINVDFVTILNLTLRDIDTSGHFANALIRLRGRNNQTSISGVRILGCRLIGTPVFSEISVFNSSARGTHYGIWLAKQNVTDYADVIVEENYFEKVNFGVFINAGTSLTNVSVENNTFNAIFNRVDGNGNHGAGIHFDRVENASGLNILNNVIDFRGGGGAPLNGIHLYSSSSTAHIQAVIDGNSVLNRLGKLSGGTFQTNGFSAIGVGMNSGNFNHDILISNNMIAGNKIRQPGGAIGTLTGIAVSCNNARIYHNTIVNPLQILSTATNEFSRALELRSRNVEVMNNIIIDHGSTSSATNTVLALVVVDTTGLVSDYNIFDVNSGQLLASLAGNSVSSLSGLQAITGTDSNSLSKEIEFVGDSDLHLTDCQMQDPDLAGTPLPAVTVDIDGDARSTTAPTIGADEAVLNNTRYWEDPFSAELPGSPFSIAAGIFDNIIGDGLAVPNFDSNQVLLFHSTGRSFIHSGTVSTDFVPTSVLFHDFDDDGHLDLIVGGYNPGRIKIFWGDGGGGFPSASEIETPGVTNIIPGFSISGWRPLLVPIGEVFGYLLNLGNRQLCFELQSFTFLTDTLDSFIHAATFADVDGDDTTEIVGIGITDGKFAFWGDIRTPVIVPTPPCGFAFERYGEYAEFQFQTATYSEANSIIKGDFDRDGDIDFITTSGVSAQLLFIRNQGNFNFIAEPILVDDFPRALVTLDYDNDGDLDFVTANSSTVNGISLFLNNGAGNFTHARSCFQALINGVPNGIVARDFDTDGRTDIAVVTSFDKLFVLYNTGTPTSVESQPAVHIPLSYVLEQNYPNPFNPSTTIRFELGKPDRITITVVDLLGRTVATLIDEQKPAGEYTVQWNGKGVNGPVASGVYLYQLRAGAATVTKKMMLLK